MKIIHSEVHETSETESVTHCKFDQAAAAILINHKSQGYGKFVLDPQTISNLETNLSLLDSFDRKHMILTMNDMIKTGKISGSCLLRLLENGLASEPAEYILSFCF